MDDGVRQAIDAELALLRPDVRRRPDRAAVLLHPDFTEVGSSGRRWNRDEILAAMADELSMSSAEVTVGEVAGTQLADDVVHLRYATTVDGRTSLRSSVWRRVGDRWQLWFHQGTPVPEQVRPTAADARAGE